MGFVIETKKPKIIVKSDSTQKVEAIHFTQESSGDNKAIGMSVKNFLIFDQLKRVNADYIVLDVALKNKMKSQKVIVSNGSNHPSAWINKSSEDYEYKEAIPTYRIPDIMQHLYLSVNNGAEQSIDLMSLLIDKPLIDYNTNIVEVYPEHEKEGRIAFRLPQNTNIEQLSLHYYDTKYGNINIPIVGEMKEKVVDVTQLPTKAYKKMNDNFSITVTGYDVKEKIGTYKAKKDASFEVVEIDIQSKVYALLKFNPSERFYLKVGDTYSVKLHPVTQELPLGLYKNASLSPGANNKFRLAFYVPKGMEELSRTLMVELKGKDVMLPIKVGKNGIEKQVLAQGSVEGTALKVNGIYSHNDKMLIDITFEDEEDAYSTRLHDAFYLNVKPEMPNTSSRKMVRDFDGDDIKQSSGMGSFTHTNYKAMYAWYPLIKSSDKIFGYQKEETILDGNKKRVFLWFDNQFSRKSTKPWYLVSSLFKDLKFKIDNEPKPLPKALAYALVKPYPYTPRKDSIDDKVLAMVKAFKTKKEKEENITQTKQHIATLESTKEKSRFVTIPVMSASMYGEDKLTHIKTLKGLIDELKQLQWVPSAYDVTTSLYSTSAILTQGWGSENEMFKAVYDKVKGKNVRFGSYTLSDEGTLKLLEWAGFIPLQKKVPFIEWEEEGMKGSLVLPFLQPVEEVQKYIENKTYLTQIIKKQAQIKMTLTYMPKNDGTATKSFGMFGGALGGGTTTEKTNVIFDKSWNIDEVSDTPVDIYFPQTTAFYIDANGTHQDKAHALNDKKVEPKVLTVEITMPDGKLDTYEHHFKSKQELQDMFFTFALGTPDIPRNILHEMENKRAQLFKGKKKKQVAPASFLQWLNRAKIYKFITLQTANERRLEKVLGVQAKHNKSPRAIMTLLENRPHGKPVSSLDIRRVFNDVYGDENRTRSFNVMSGIFNAQAEAKVIPGGKGIFDFWEAKDKNITMILPTQKSVMVDLFKKKGIDKRIIDRLVQSDKVWLYPMHMKKHIGWLEIDPKNYRMVSVYENGMYAAMTEEAEIDALINSATQYFLGFYSGTFASVSTLMMASMLIPDFCTAVSVAETSANNMACGVGVATSQFTGIGILGAGLGCAGLSDEAMGVSVAASMAGNKTLGGKLVGGFLGFGNGFGNAVAVYFAAAKKAGSCK
jgi:hypothetical protein